MPRQMGPLAAYAALALLTSVPFFARHSAAGPVLAGIYAAGLCALCWLTAAQPGFSRTPVATMLGFAAIAGLATTDWLFYPATRRVPHPSTAPDAMILPFQRLLQGVAPYGARLYDGAPISPGPGWIFLNAIFTEPGLIGLMGPAWLALAAWLVGRAGGSVLNFVALVLAPLAFLQMSVVGSDIFVTSLAFAALTVAALRAKRTGRSAVWLGMLAGTVATARLPMVLLPPIIGLSMARGGQVTRAWIFTGVALTVALVWHGAAFAMTWWHGDFYQPLHLFGRARAGAGPLFAAVGLAGGFAASLFIARRLRGVDSDALFAQWLLQTSLFLPIGLGELVRVQQLQWAEWEGKNYAAFPLPLLAAALVLRSAAP